MLTAIFLLVGAATIVIKDIRETRYRRAVLKRILAR
jgi:hypothetical protein